MAKCWWITTLLTLGMVVGCGDDGGGGNEPENSVTACQDGLDNDADGFTDCDDQDCQGFGFCQVVTCAEAPCDEHAVCDDSSGAAVCTCAPGWEGNGETCSNVDECTGGIHDCEQTCVDTDGSYACGCTAGYQVNVDGHSCDPLDCGTLDAPTSGNVDLPDGTTFGAVATYGCAPGYFLQGDAERTCDATSRWSGEAPSCAVCDVSSMNDCLCEGASGTVRCVGDAAVGCDAGGGLESVETCSAGHCLDDLGCQVCLAGEVGCWGNEVRSCNATPPAAWETIEICAAADGYRCDATQGACVLLSDLEVLPATGSMYQFASFHQGTSVFLGGHDVASYGDYLYVNRGPAFTYGWLDVYQVALQDSDGDGVSEPNQHPQDPDSPGPLEERVLTLVASYSASADGVPLWQASRCEMHATADRLYLLGFPHDGTLFEWDIVTHASSVAVAPVTSLALDNLGYGSVDGLWYGASPAARRVYSFHAPTQEWVAEFQWAALTGTHISGLEVVVDPSTNEQYVYVAEYTGDYLAQFRRDGAGGWVKQRVFQNEGTAGTVNGMGFGALGHFWVTDGENLYELGGGDVTEYLE